MFVKSFSKYLKFIKMYLTDCSMSVSVACACPPASAIIRVRSRVLPALLMCAANPQFPQYIKRIFTQPLQVLLREQTVNAMKYIILTKRAECSILLLNKSKSRNEGAIRFANPVRQAKGDIDDYQKFDGKISW